MLLEGNDGRFRKALRLAAEIAEDVFVLGCRLLAAVFGFLILFWLWNQPARERPGRAARH